MAAYMAAQEAQQAEQSRKRRAKGGQGGSRGKGKGWWRTIFKILIMVLGGKGGKRKNRPPKEVKIPTEFRRYDKNDPQQVRCSQ